MSPEPRVGLVLAGHDAKGAVLGSLEQHACGTWEGKSDEWHLLDPGLTSYSTCPSMCLPLLLAGLVTQDLITAGSRGTLSVCSPPSGAMLANFSSVLFWQLAHAPGCVQLVKNPLPLTLAKAQPAAASRCALSAWVPPKKPALGNHSARRLHLCP